MMGIDSAMLAEIMLRDFRVPLIHGQVALALQQAELLLGHANHDRALAPAQGAIADEAGIHLPLDFEFHCAAMARPFVNGHFHLQDFSIPLFKESPAES